MNGLHMISKERKRHVVIVDSFSIQQLHGIEILMDSDKEEEWEEYCRKMVMTNDQWWEDWLAKMNKYMEEQHNQPPPPPQPKPTVEETEKAHKELEATKCRTCFKECDEEYLDRNLLCPECVKKGSDDPSFVKIGDPETAFLFRDVNLDVPEYRIMKAVNYLECVKGDCKYELWHLNEMKTKVKVFRMLFDHYVSQHYNLLEKEHSNFQNLTYAILQEFVIFEANTKKAPRNKDKTNACRIKRSLAMHNLMKHMGIPLNMLATAIGRSQSDIGNYSYEGIEHCHICSK